MYPCHLDMDPRYPFNHFFHTLFENLFKNYQDYSFMNMYVEINIFYKNATWKRCMMYYFLLSYKLYGPPIPLSFIYGVINPKIFRLSQALSGLIVHSKLYIKGMNRRVQVRFKCSNFKHFISKTFVYLSLTR